MECDLAYLNFNNILMASFFKTAINKFARNNLVIIQNEGRLLDNYEDSLEQGNSAGGSPTNTFRYGGLGLQKSNPSIKKKTTLYKVQNEDAGVEQ